MKELEEVVARYKQLFGLINWRIFVQISPNVEKEEDAASYAAKTYANPIYNQAVIVFSDKIKPEDIENIVIHELLHVVMALYDFSVDNLTKEGSDEQLFIARENAVSQLTNIFTRIIKG